MDFPKQFADRVLTWDVSIEPETRDANIRGVSTTINAQKCDA
jgi:hypothetical protein